MINDFPLHPTPLSRPPSQKGGPFSSNYLTSDVCSLLSKLLLFRLQFFMSGSNLGWPVNYDKVPRSMMPLIVSMT